MIDLVLAGDNAVVVGTIAAGLPKSQQKKVVFVGVAAALVLRIVFALAATQLLQVIGLRERLIGSRAGQAVYRKQRRVRDLGICRVAHERGRVQIGRAHV